MRRTIEIEDESMAPSNSRPSPALTAALVKCYEPIMRSLRRQFPHAGETSYEEAQQCAAVDALRRDGKGFVPASGWEAYLHWLSARRMLDFLNEGLRQRFRNLGGLDPHDVADINEIAARSPSPQDQVLYEERRGRQTATLLTVLQAYCRKQEASVERLRQKEAYERSLRGQTPKAIADAMGMLRNTIDQSLNRARDALVKALKDADGSRSVFLTVFEHLGDAAPKDSSEPQNGRPQPPGSAGPTTGAAAKGANSNNDRRAAQLPHFDTFADVVLWVIDEGGAMCPTTERLVEYHRDPQAPTCTDLRYHIGEAGCRLCQANLELIGQAQSPDSLVLDTKQHEGK